MRITPTAKRELRRQIAVFIKLSENPVGLMAHYGMGVGENIDNLSILNDHILAICGCSEKQAEKWEQIDFLGYKIHISKNTLKQIDENTIDYIEWTDLKTGVNQYYFQLR